VTPPPASQPAWSKQAIRDLLPPDTDDGSAKRPKTAPKTEPQEPVRRDEPSDFGPARGPGGEGMLPALPLAGLGQMAWLVLAGLLGAAVVVALVLYLKQRRARPPIAVKTEKAALSLEALLAQTDRPVGEGLWRQADDLARAGHWLEAVRALYLAVLAHLHRADLIRYAQTRTNGEYLDQLRQREELHAPFEGLTSLFELKYYGEKTCQPDDFQHCRQFAEQLRTASRERA